MARKPPDWDDTPTKEEMRQMNGVWAMEDIREERAQREHGLKKTSRIADKVERKISPEPSEDKPSEDKSEDKPSEDKTHEVAARASDGKMAVTGTTGDSAASTLIGQHLRSAWAPGGPYRYNIRDGG